MIYMSSQFLTNNIKTSYRGDQMGKNGVSVSSFDQNVQMLSTVD